MYAQGWTSMPGGVVRWRRRRGDAENLSWGHLCRFTEDTSSLNCQLSTLTQVCVCVCVSAIPRLGGGPLDSYHSPSLWIFLFGCLCARVCVCVCFGVWGGDIINGGTVRTCCRFRMWWCQTRAVLRFPFPEPSVLLPMRLKPLFKIKLFTLFYHSPKPTMRLCVAENFTIFTSSFVSSPNQFMNRKSF